MKTLSTSDGDPLDHLRLIHGPQAVEEAALAALHTYPQLDRQSRSFPEAVRRELRRQPLLSTLSEREYQSHPAEVDSEPRWDDAYPWPSLSPMALYGPAGEIVQGLAPYTEADPAALLASLLVLFGNYVGATPHATVGAVSHPGRLFVCVVGQSARSRKGQSFEEVAQLFRGADASYLDRARVSGLSSGEGLVAHLGAQATDDEKLALIYEPEFSRVLSVAGRDGSILSAILRDAWDTGNLHVLTRKEPLRARNAHISILTHITTFELSAKLNSIDVANGFANRFLLLCAKRSKLLPDGGQISILESQRLVSILGDMMKRSRGISKVTRSPEASEVWADIYHRLGDDPGFLGALTARADAQLLRLQVLFAIMDGSGTIEVSHVRASQAVWEYCRGSCLHVFGSRFEDPVADTMLRALRETYPAGLTGTQQRDLFNRHESSERLEQARGELEARCLIRTIREQTKGRPTIVSYAIPKVPRDTVATKATKAT